MSIILLFLRSHVKEVIFILLVLGALGYVKFLQHEVAAKKQEVETIQLQLTKANSELADLHQKSIDLKQKVTEAEQKVIVQHEVTTKIVTKIQKEIIPSTCDGAIKFAIDNKEELLWD